MRTSPRFKLILNFALVYIIWGSTYLAIRFAIETVPPFLMAGVRFLIAGALMLTWARLRGAAWPTRKQWRAATIVGLLLLVGGNGGVTWAEQVVPSGLASLMVTTVPIWMVLMDWVRPGGIRPAAQVFGGLALGMLGIVLLVGPGELAGAGGIHPLGAAVLLFAAFSWSLGSTYGRNVELPQSPRMNTALQMLTAGGVMLLMGLGMGEAARIDMDAVSLRSVLATLYLVIFGSIVGFSAYLYIMQHATAAQVGTYAYVNPVVAVFLGWALANEAVTPRILIGAATIIAAVAIITTFRTRPAPSTTPTRPQPATQPCSEAMD